MELSIFLLDEECISISVIAFRARSRDSLPSPSSLASLKGYMIITEMVILLLEEGILFFDRARAGAFHAVISEGGDDIDIFIKDTRALVKKS